MHAVTDKGMHAAMDTGMRALMDKGMRALMDKGMSGNGTERQGECMRHLGRRECARQNNDPASQAAYGGQYAVQPHPAVVLLQCKPCYQPHHPGSCMSRLAKQQGSRQFGSTLSEPNGKGADKQDELLET